MRYDHRSEKIRFAILVGLLAGCFLMGGASRLDVTSLVLLQPAAALCIVAFLLIPGPIDWRSVRVPILLLGALAGLMTAQLIPLPPALWSNLPGHAPFAQSASVAGLEQPWRPISLTPDLTLASLVGLVIPFAVLVGFAAVDQHRRHTLLPVILIGTALSSLFALGQVSGGGQSPLYLYEITNLGTGVGLFSNRNHQAVLLAMAWPMLMVWAALPYRDAKVRQAIRWIAAGFALFLLPLLLVTGSRAGLALGLVALLCAALIWWKRRVTTGASAKKGNPIFAIAVGVGAVVVVASSILLSRAEAIQRMLDLQTAEDTRVAAMPVLFEMSGDFLPIGSGFGSFDPLFRSYEPLSMLDPRYLNHAHNDLLELVITAGVPGLVILLLFMCWFALRSFRAWRATDSSSTHEFARLASVMILLVLLSSLVDYPLRTPTMMAIFAIACGWLGSSRPAEARGPANA